MKREIKFRGMRHDGTWCYGGITSYLHSPKSKTQIVSCEHFEGKEEKEHYKFINVKEETVGQFTGLTDKNGKEIYEGDLVNYSFDDVLNIKCGDYIKFDAGYFQIYREGKTYHPVISDAKYIEVIGNLYETPELLPTRIHK